jgi:hypothetical protein
MTPASEKDFRASSITTFILSTKGVACLAFFLLLKLAFWTPFSCWIIDGWGGVKRG